MRLLALIKKEFLAIRNDKRNMFAVIFPPLLQILIFSFAATTEVKHADLALYDMDGSAQSREFAQTLKGSSYISKLISVQNYNRASELLDRREIIGFVVIPNGFSKDLGSANSKVQVILDGRRSNTAQVVDGYISQILLNFGTGLGAQNPIAINTRFLYNQSLNNYWWIVPNLFGSITMLLAIILSALSIAREKEMGTFEQLLVSPLSAHEILLGKLIPGLLISVFISTLILLIAIYGYKVPFLGSFWILYFGVVVFLFAVSGVGLFISSLCKTQQQAILGAFVFLLPSFLLSGFATPVENMPLWLQPVSDIIPLKYYIILIKGVFLKDISLALALPLILKIFALGVVSLGAALILFKKKVG